MDIKTTGNSLLFPFNTNFKLTEFISIDDTINLYYGLQHTCKNKKNRVLDLGCGSGIVGIQSLLNNEIDYYMGVDINKQSIRIANQNAQANNLNKNIYNFYLGDICNNIVKDSMKMNTYDVLLANLPYLPVPHTYTSSVDGGSEGTKYVPSIILDYANVNNINTIVFNFSSLTSPRKIIHKLMNTQFFIDHIYILKAPFGNYTSQFKDFYETNSNFFCFNNSQLILTVVLNKNKENVKYNDFLDILESYQKNGVVMNHANCTYHDVDETTLKKFLENFA